MKIPRLFLQQDSSDCGVACLLTIINFYSGRSNIDTLRKLSGTNKTGTTLLGLYQAAQKLGFEAKGIKSDIDFLVKSKTPTILHILNQNKQQHFIVCFGLKSTNKVVFVIGDPAKGIIYMTPDELDSIWKSKACLTLETNENFVKAKDDNIAKRKWIANLVKEDSPILIIAVVLGIALASLGLSMAIFSQRLIDDILPKKNFQNLYVGVGLIFLILLSKEGLSALRQHFLIRQSKAFNIRIVDFFYSKLLHLPKPFFDTRKIGELTARLNDTSRIQRVISQLAGNTIIDVLIVLVTAGFLFTYSFSIGLLCIAAIPVFYYIVYKFNKPILKQQQTVMSNYAHSEANYISTLQGIEPIKNNNKQSLFSNSNKIIYQNFQEAVFKLGKTQIRLSFFANCFGVLFLVGILFYGSYQVLQNQLKTGELIAILSISGTLLPSVANLALISIPINEAKIAFDRMFEFTAAKPEKEGASENKIDNFQSLCINNLTFRFAGHSQLLRNVSFAVNKGEIIAIMGENGCGKSTLSQIIQRHYQPESGEVLVNKSSMLENLQLNNWRNIYAVVPQNIHIFNGTVLENIAFDEAACNPEKAIQFLQQYGFATFMDSLPQSVFTLVGEEGIILSGGQKQIIALARALYSRPQLLILDEATAAMDRDSEQFVLQLLTQLKKEMSVIFITHRLHVLKSFCDRIYILEKGVITAVGNHDTLLQTKNLYSKYWADLVS